MATTQETGFIEGVEKFDALARRDEFVNMPVPFSSTLFLKSDASLVEFDAGRPP